MRTCHPVGCTCDQMWHHRRPAVEMNAARRSERQRMNAAREVGKTMSNLARERRSWNAAQAASGSGPP